MSRFYLTTGNNGGAAGENVFYKAQWKLVEKCSPIFFDNL